MNLLQMSLSGAVMILVIVVIRALAIHKLPKKAFLALWGAAAARLLIPCSFRSALSAYSLLKPFAPAAEAGKNVPAVPFTPMAPVQHMAPLPAASAGNMAAVSFHPWMAAWAVGVLACAVFFAMAYLKCRKEFQASLPVDNEYAKRWLNEHRIARTIEIRQSGRISAPLTYGVFRPVILMPKTADWDDLDTLNYVLAHEYVHIRRFDAVAKLALTVALCVHWFNPAVWIMYVLANRDIELSCDEAVIRQFGERTKAAYAMALIRMEESRSGLTPLCNNFSKNAIEERIVAIMKIKKTSLAALIVAAALVVGVTTAFATFPKADENASPRADVPVMEGTDLLSYVDSEDGKTYYSFDGGKTFQPLTDEEYEARFPSPDVEWWTYDEYKAWLENEKVELQSMIGERGWTGGRGEFVWTQEIVDETIAMYEDILKNIQNGMLYAKTIDGEGDMFGMVTYEPANTASGVHESPATAADFAPYAPYGLAWDEGEKALFWNGQRVRYFLDGADMDEMGAMAVRLEYADAEFVGDIDVHTVRQRVQNADGSFNPMGPLTGLEQYSQADYDMNTLTVATALEAEACTTQEISEALEGTQALLQAYIPFGLSCETDASTGEISMRWQGKPVHSVYDAEKGAWIANSMRGLYLGPDAVDLEAVYEQGELTGLRETPSQPATEIAFAAEGSAAEPGTAFAELFEKYAPFGITYVEAAGASGAGNVYYNGQLVSQFADLAPGGGAFTFSSAEQGNFSVKTVYGNHGRLIGVEAVAD
ncbi:MAG: M56 family metallopeptidase [Eubacteriales bacterium]|nr:M56 family metallopeptidase [Eubacteriales bacterium]